jgi:acylphosphatase
MTRVHARIRGRVQGVAFRAYTQDEAERLGLSGWVRNREDGSVELWAEGDETALRTLIAWCKHGPPAARVESVDADWGEAEGKSAGFHIRH